MMVCQKVNKDLSVAGQLQAGQLGAFREAGLRSLICNRPDGEAPDQPSDGEVEEQARLPVLSYRGTARRSATLRALSESGRQPVAEILAATKDAGFDLGELAARLAGDAAP